MKYLLTFLLIIAIFAVVFTITPSFTSPTAFVVAENSTDDSNKTGLPNFRVYTKAVCDNISNFIVCHDELFAVCGNFEYRLPENNVNGKGIFNEDWKDPRND